MAQSENLLPFVLGVTRATRAAGAARGGGSVEHSRRGEIRRQGFTQTARRFARHQPEAQKVGKGKSLQGRIDERGKLSKAGLWEGGYIVMAGAGGKISARRAFRLREAEDLVVDQTLYWKVVGDADEAWFQVGMLNSVALTNATLAFNPKGRFRRTASSTLPYRMMPAYDPGNGDHRKIAALAKDIAVLAEGHCTTDPHLTDPTKALTARRRRLRVLLEASPLLVQLKSLDAVRSGRRIRRADRREWQRAGGAGMLIVQNAAEPASLRNALVDIVAAGAIDIRVASAYVTLGGANILLSAVANAVGTAAFAAMPKTLVTSFDFGLTEPQALQQWHALANATVFVSGAQRLAQSFAYAAAGLSP